MSVPPWDKAPWWCEQTWGIVLVATPLFVFALDWHKMFEPVATLRSFGTIPLGFLGAVLVALGCVHVWNAQDTRRARKGVQTK